MKSLRFAPFAALLVAAAASAQEVKLARTFKVGDEARYRTTVTFEAMGTEGKAVRTARVVVKEIKENKVTTVSIDEGGTLELGGSEQPAPPGGQTTEVREPGGKLLDVKWDEASETIMTPEIIRLTATTSETVLVDKPVKAGDTWTVEIDNPAVKGKKVTFKGTFVGLDKVDGVDYWKVKQVCEAETDADGKKMKVEMTSWLDPANGQSVKSEGKLTNLPTRYGDMNWNLKTERLKPEKKAAA